MRPELAAMQPLLYPLDAPVTGDLPSLWLTAALPLLLVFGLVLLARQQRRKRLNSVQPPIPQTMEQQLLSALEELQHLPAPAPGEQAGPWLQQLNLLLKRFCAVRYPDIASHKLSGREWLAFLDSRCPAAGLTRFMILVQGSYLPDCRLSDHQIEGLHAAITSSITFGRGSSRTVRGEPLGIFPSYRSGAKSDIAAVLT